jgi:D-alanyl-D-alanine carboxypeptidase/D-alanyl-D-alanine-endopeptidase (penicillin-binding protein 4)
MTPVRLARAFAALAGFAACSSAPPAADLDDAMRELVMRPELAGARVGTCVVDAETGRSMLEHDADRGFATASNMKLASAAVALATCGPEHRVATEVWMRGDVRDGTLSGELILRGHGDPTFGTGEAGRAAFASVVAALRARGVQRVVGRVVGDDAWLGSEHLGLGWQWDYLDEDYAAPFGGLCCCGNVVRVRVRPGATAPEIECTPAVLPAPRVRVQQVAADDAAPTRLTAQRALGSETIEVLGTLRADAAPQVFVVPVPDPAVFAARVLRNELAAAGIEVTDGAASPHGDEVLVASVPSPPLAEIVQHLLLHSDNLEAEQVVRVAARTATGDGSSASTARHVAATLARLGVDTQGLVVADGSGLSRRNLARPRQLVGVLAAMWASPHRDLFVQALPLAGVSGTLRTRLLTGPANGRVRAKTGFISRVVCLSGYVPRPDVHRAPLLFSVMLEDFTCSEDAAKAAVDAFVQRLAASAGW